MKKQFSRLSKVEQERVEAWYHKQNPNQFDDVMRNGSTHTPNLIKLPTGLAATLKSLAKKEGEPDYQTMATRWLKERAAKETRPAAKLSQKTKRKSAKTQSQRGSKSTVK
jgi:TFIIF-interacting CTD phosphatase-like protein